MVMSGASIERFVDNTQEERNLAKQMLGIIFCTDNRNLMLTAIDIRTGFVGLPTDYEELCDENGDLRTSLCLVHNHRKDKPVGLSRVIDIKTLEEYEDREVSKALGLFKSDDNEVCKCGERAILKLHPLKYRARVQDIIDSDDDEENDLGSIRRLQLEVDRQHLQLYFK